MLIINTLSFQQTYPEATLFMI